MFFIRFWRNLTKKDSLRVLNKKERKILLSLFDVFSWIRIRFGFLAGSETLLFSAFSSPFLLSFLLRDFCPLPSPEFLPVANGQLIFSLFYFAARNTTPKLTSRCASWASTCATCTRWRRRRWGACWWRSAHATAPSLPASSQSSGRRSPSSQSYSS